MKYAYRFTTLGPVGHLRPAPGTWGSLAALPLAYLLIGIGGVWLFSAMIILMAVLGTKAIAEVIATRGDTDPSEVVIDELVGQWIALWPVAFGMYWVGLDPWLFLWPGYVTAFAAFRLFDITKPWLIGQADRRGDALGVMLDDIWAGVFAGLVVIVFGVLAHIIMV